MKKLYIPSGLKIDFAKDDEELDSYHYLLNLIYEQRILYKVEGPVPLKALYLRNIIRNYKQYRDTLIDHQMLECDFHYVSGQKSYAYGLTEFWEQQPAVATQILSDKMQERLESWQSRRIPLTRIHTHLYDFLSEIEIDIEALDYIKSLPIGQYNRALISIEKFLDKDFYIYSDEFGERTHTNLTNLKSDLRQFLSWKGKRLVNIDISCSQPLLLLQIFNHPLYPYDAQGSDYSLYQRLVETGTLYDFLLENSKVKEKINTRSELKEVFFRDVLFGRRTASWFVDLFPTIGQMVKKAKKKDYKKVAWMMQREESRIVITKICGRILKHHPDVFISTIHDSIMTVPEHAGLVKSIIESEFAKIGINPTVRVEGG